MELRGFMTSVVWSTHVSKNLLIARWHPLRYAGFELDGSGVVYLDT